MPHQEEPSLDPPAEADASRVDMTDGELAEAKRYGRAELVCELADKAIDVAYLAVAAFLLARPLDAWLQTYRPLAANWSLRLAALLLVVTAIHIAVSFPLSFYSGHVLEHRFKLSTQSFAQWFWRYVKRNLVGIGFSLGMVEGLYWLIWTTGGAWWLLAAGAFFLVAIVLVQLAPLFLPLFYHVEKLDAPELADRLARLAQGTGLSIEGIYRLDLSAETVKANAMLAGWGPTRRVLLGDTLLAGFLPDEIEVIFAHEIGHHVLRHLRKMILISLVYSAAGFWVCDRLLTAWVAHGGAATSYAGLPVGMAWLTPGGAFAYSRLPVDTLPLLLLILAVFGMLLQPLQNALSRRFERQSDRYALERTGLKDAYLSAFRKLARLNKDDPSPHWLDVLLFHSHPPVAERLAMAMESGEKKEQAREKT